jgi:hypothetical protein
MKRYIRIILPLFLIVAAFTLYSACSCKCGKNKDGDNTLKGYITVVGNEPFTKLAIRTDDNKIFLLQLSNELKEKLWKEQGTYYYVTYGDLREQEGVATIVVEKVVPLNKETK